MTPELKYIMKYLLLNNQTVTKKTIETLLKVMQKDILDLKITAKSKYAKQIEYIQEQLVNAYNRIIEGSNVILIDEMIFNDFQKIIKIEYENKKSGSLSGFNNDNIISSVDLASKIYNKAGWTGDWLNLIGDPVEPFSLMFWSKPGKGKSTLAIKLSYYLASEKNKKILYISKDEGDSYTMQEKFQRLKAFHPNIEISNGYVPRDLSKWDYVIFDLMNDFNFSYNQFKVDFIEKYREKNVSFISLFKSTIDGNYRGNKDWENLFDVSIFINDEGVAQAQKNRFGANGMIEVLG